MDLRGCCNRPERSRTRAVVSREEEDGTNLRKTEEVESADLVIQWQKDGSKMIPSSLVQCFSTFWNTIHISTAQYTYF